MNGGAADAAQLLESSSSTHEALSILGWMWWHTPIIPPLGGPEVQAHPQLYEVFVSKQTNKQAN